MDAKTHITDDELARRFQFHPTDAVNQQGQLEDVQAICLEAASVIVQATGATSREQSTAITKIEEAFMWARTAIERADGPSI